MTSRATILIELLGCQIPVEPTGLPRTAVPDLAAPVPHATGRSVGLVHAVRPARDIIADVIRRAR
jgi:hypothetical protein